MIAEQKALLEDYKNGTLKGIEREYECPFFI